MFKVIFQILSAIILRTTIKKGVSLVNNASLNVEVENLTPIRLFNSLFIRMRTESLGDISPHTCTLISGFFTYPVHQGDSALLGDMVS